MRVSYYGYYLRDQRTGNKYLIDLRPFIRAFCGAAPTDLKNKVMHYDEHLYLFHLTGDLYLLIRTRSHEIIKKVNAERVDVSEIYDLFEHDEYLGFASYVLLRDHFLAFASTILAPKLKIFSYLVDQVFEILGIEYYEFSTQAFLHQATRDEVLRLPFLGRTVIEVQKNNDFGDHLLGVLGVETEDTEDISSFEMIIKPKKRKNIERAIKAFVRHMPDEGIDKLIIRAKEEIDGQITDLYLAGMGAISDSIDRRDEGGLEDALRLKITGNPLLGDKVREFISNDEFNQTDLNDILHFGDPASWPASLADL